MPQPGGSAPGPRPPHSQRRPARDWRRLLRDLAEMVPWPRAGGGRRTQREVLQNVLGYIQFLRRILSIVRGGTDPPSNGRPTPAEAPPPAGDPPARGGDTAEGGPSSPPGQRLVPYEEEELGGDPSPWFCPTGPNWEALGGEKSPALSPAPQREGLWGLSPALLASPPPPGSPSDVTRDLFRDVYLSPQRTGRSPQARAVAPRASGSSVTPGVAMGTRGPPQGQQRRGQGGPPRPKKKCVNGFIMFCCLNRELCKSAHPGLPPTDVTRELAQLWRSLSPAQRRPYCRRARRFSRLHDRVLRPERDEDGDGDGDTEPLAPLELVLATRAGTLGGGPLPP